MKKNLLLILGVATVLGSCSNDEVVDQQEINVSKSDVKVAIAAESVTVTQTRAALDGWDNTPICVWGLAKNAANWTDASSKLFTSGYVKGTVSNGGAVQLGEKAEDVYFYPLNSNINFSFYACSPEPASAPTLQATSVIASYQINGNNDILWGGAEANDITNDEDGKKYSGYNARYFRKGGAKPILTFDHKLTRLNFKAKKGQEKDDGSVIPVKIENITIAANSNATMTVAGTNAGSLTAVGGLTELPVFFGDDTYAKRGALTLADDFSEAVAGTVMVLPTTGSYTITVTLSATIDGKTVFAEPSSFEISYTDKAGRTSFEAGKAYTIRLTVYGLRKVEFEKAILTPWDTETEIIDQEVN